MKKFRWFLVCASLSLGSCASLANGLGAPSKEEFQDITTKVKTLETENQQLKEELRKTLVAMASLQGLGADMDSLKKAQEALLKRIDLLPKETLKALAALLSKSLEETPPPKEMPSTK